MVKQCDAVFEGGGVKGIGLAGAAAAIEGRGYKFINVAGTSAGAIVASLLAVGYTGAEIRDELLKLDFTKFHKRDFLNNLGVFGKVSKIILKYGVYDTDYIEDWLTELLKRKGKLYFSDVKNKNYTDDKYAYKFQAIASDLSAGTMLVLPGELKTLGFEPDRFSIAKAVVMSLSIPVFYEPYVLTDINGKRHIVVDGGLLSNYPIWLLDNKSKAPERPTFGFKFCDSHINENSEQEYNSIKNFFDFSKSLVSTALDGHDKHYISISKGDFQRTITISPKIKCDEKEKIISTVYFDITKKESEALYQNGAEASEKFLSDWDFEEWKKKHRNG